MTDSPTAGAARRGAARSSTPAASGCRGAWARVTDDKVRPLGRQQLGCMHMQPPVGSLSFVHVSSVRAGHGTALWPSAEACDFHRSLTSISLFCGATENHRKSWP
jgi:hypothetical protein